MRLLAAVLALCLGTAAGAQNMAFSIAPTRDCLQSTADPQQRRACAGLAARSCMQQNNSGETTVGRSFCLDQERGHWDAWLNAAYAAIGAKAQNSDVEMAQIGAFVPKTAEALRDMQRAWMRFRDMTCNFEMSQWGGGSGSGPAGLQCLMRMTADQAIYLERAWWGE